jgi:serine/threonine protein kinase
MPRKKTDEQSDAKTPPSQAQAPTANSDPFTGRRVGNCDVLEKICEGGTAYVYKAYNVRFELQRVLKILKPSLNDEEDFYARFRQEAQLTARLDHQNILRVFDTGEVDGYFYIEMEHIPGETLRTYLGRNPRISEREVLHFASQIARALDYAHNIKIEAPNKQMIAGILHRDLKPENIMVLPDKTVKIMDFGAAKPLNITSNTMQGMIVGTFHYMSPEQIDGRPLDARSDFFSLGIVLYELLTGQKPFTGANLTSLIEKIKAGRYQKASRLRPAITPMTEELIEKLLARDPDHRFRNAREIEESTQISLQAFNTWGAGRNVRVPFSFKRVFPTLSLTFSVIALILSTYAVLRTPKGAGGNVPFPQESAISLLDRARELEQKEQWQEAVEMYELVPPIKEGGVANEYLEAQIRLARIYFKHLNQFTKARSILEKIRMAFSDPAIDAYLGQIYFRLALYNEARDRLDVAMRARKGSVMPQTDEYRREMFYYYASALDRQYTYVDRDPRLLVEAIKAWDYYLDFSACGQGNGDEDCKFGRERRAELAEIDEAQKRN